MKRLHAKDRVRIRERRVDRSARDHAVVIVRIALDLGEALAPAGRAALPVRALRRTAVALRDDFLAGRRREMRSAVAEVDDAVDVRLAVGADRERRVERVRARVPEVVLDHCIAARETVRRGLDTKVAGETAAADPEHLAVPARRQAIDRADVRAGRRGDRHVHLAERREVLARVGGDRGHGHNFRVAEHGVRREAAAGVLRVRSGRERRSSEDTCERGGTEPDLEPTHRRPPSTKLARRVSHGPLTRSKERRARRTAVDGRRALDRCLVRDAPLGILACVPIYEYKCRKCKKRFEELVKIGETPQCPRCHDPNPEQLFSMTAAVSTSTTREKSLRIARGVARSVKREKDHADAVYHSNYIKEHSEPAAPARTKQAAAAARKPTAASKRTAAPKPTKNRRGK